MKRILSYILVILLFWATAIYAAPPGGGYNGYRTFYAMVTVRDLDGYPLGGVQVSMYAELYGSEGMGLGSDHAITNSSGCAHLSTTVYYQGYEGNKYLRVLVSDDRYTVISASPTYTFSSFQLYPEFKVTTTQAFVEKYCPTLRLHHPTEWIAPEPVEYLGVSKKDLWFVLYNKQGIAVGDYPIRDEVLFDPPIRFFHEWVNHPYPNYSFLKGDAYHYAGKPPKKTYGHYWLRFHYNYAGRVNKPSQWISYYETERKENAFPHTVYAHLFWLNDQPVIQYWFYYPYNDGYNNHEGDWEHINVRLKVDRSSPSTSISIEAIDFYFHHKVMTLTSGYEIEDGTHPVVYVGGSCAGIDWPASCEPGNTTGGSYPWPGVWYDVGAFGYDEYVSGEGPTVPYHSITVKVLPNLHSINFDVHPELSWLKAKIRWGELDVSSPWDFFDDLKEVGNSAPPGPAYNKGWERVGAVKDAYEEYRLGVSILGRSSLRWLMAALYHADVSAGTGDYVYQWYQKIDGIDYWFPLGTQLTQFITMDRKSLTLRVDVYDRNTTQQAMALKGVEYDDGYGLEVSIEGPSTLKNMETGVYSTRASKGSGCYRYQWYMKTHYSWIPLGTRKDQWVTMSDRSFYLGVDVHDDFTGRDASAEKQVFYLGQYD